MYTCENSKCPHTYMRAISRLKFSLHNDPMKLSIQFLVLELLNFESVSVSNFFNFCRSSLILTQKKLYDNFCDKRASKSVADLIGKETFQYFQRRETPSFSIRKRIFAKDKSSAAKVKVSRPDSLLCDSKL